MRFQRAHKKHYKLLSPVKLVTKANNMDKVSIYALTKWGFSKMPFSVRKKSEIARRVSAL